jgi:arylsulfatase A-like enzyme
MPTLCTVVGYDVGKDLKWDGKDVWPLICGQAATAEPRLFYWKTPNASAVRHGNWKLVVGKKKTNAEPWPPAGELYDLAADPYEKTDLASRHPDRVNELRKLLAAVSAHDRDR